MDLTKLKEYRGQIEEGRKQLHDIFEEAGPEMDMSKVKCVEGDEAVKVERIRSLNDELSELGVKAEPLEKEYADLEQAKRHAEEFSSKDAHPSPEPNDGNGEGEGPKTKSLGELFIESEAGHNLKGSEVELEGVETKSLFQRTEGWEPQNLRSGKVVDFATRPIQLIQLIPGGETGQSSVVYMEETVFTNNAAETKEGGEYKEVALKVVQKSTPVQKITAFLPITDEQLEDVPQAQGYVNNRLPFMVMQRLDSQLVNGNGEEENLSGFLHKEGIGLQEAGVDPAPDAIFKALTKVRVTGRAQPSGVCVHPNNWQNIRLLRTSAGVYIWGNPSEAGPERIWGLPATQSDALPEGTALVGDFATYSELCTRRGMEVKVSDSHSDFFTKGKQAIRASIRVALAIYRPAAFVKVTGLP